MVEVILMIKLAARLALATILVSSVLTADGSANVFSRGPYYPYSRPVRLIVLLVGCLVFNHAIQLMLPQVVA
jgi:hypothetical protein